MHSLRLYTAQEPEVNLLQSKASHPDWTELAQDMVQWRDGNKPSGYIKGGKFLHQFFSRRTLNGDYFLKQHQPADLCNGEV
jgi:hypothetical protein